MIRCFEIFETLVEVLLLNGEAVGGIDGRSTVEKEGKRRGNF
jgi:hypothetical protein